MTREIPVLEAESAENPFPSSVLAQLSRSLPEYIIEQRWYRSKAKTISNLQIEDVVPLEESKSYVLVVTIAYTDGDHEIYQLPLSFSPGELSTSDALARLRFSNCEERTLVSAIANAAFRDALLAAISTERSFSGTGGKLISSRTLALKRTADHSEPKLESSVSRAEQSNTSVIYGDRYILKMFRKLESGINPDLEIGRFLTEHGFQYTPPLLGQIEYKPQSGESMHAAILQGFVKNNGDAWNYTLESLTGFFERALQIQTAPTLSSYHPMQLAGEALPAEAISALGPYIESARLLGNRTALLHAALTDMNAGPDFVPEKVDAGYIQHLHNDMLEQARSTFELLRAKQNMLSGEAAESARKLLSAQSDVLERFSNLKEHSIEALRIRHHGDYHLGQVLATENDFIIIDFEGEPARPLAHRRLKTLAMKDVAGMVRSFSYAGYAALFGLVHGVPEAPESKRVIEEWAAYWGALVSAEFLKSYFATAGNAPFVGSNRDEHRMLFDAFVLQKAMYEVSYELNNRPTWVQIPLRGILALLN